MSVRRLASIYNTGSPESVPAEWGNIEANGMLRPKMPVPSEKQLSRLEASIRARPSLPQLDGTISQEPGRKGANKYSTLGSNRAATRVESPRSSYTGLGSGNGVTTSYQEEYDDEEDGAYLYHRPHHSKIFPFPANQRQRLTPPPPPPGLALPPYRPTTNDPNGPAHPLDMLGPGAKNRSYSRIPRLSGTIRSSSGGLDYGYLQGAVSNTANPPACSPTPATDDSPRTHLESKFPDAPTPTKASQLADVKLESENPSLWCEGSTKEPSELDLHKHFAGLEPYIPSGHQLPLAADGAVPTLPLTSNDLTPVSSSLQTDIRINALEKTVREITGELKEAKSELNKASTYGILPLSSGILPEGITSQNYVEPPRLTLSETEKTSPMLEMPLATRAKKIVLILDATQNYARPTPGAKHLRYSPPRTNLRRLSDSLTAEHKATRMRQLVYYVSGRGSGDEFGLNKSLHTTISEAYTYLSDNWSAGDEIYLFGYSHGAFAARAIAALITEIGLFNKAGLTAFETLYDTYFDPKFGKIRKTEDYEAWRESCSALAFEMAQSDAVVLHKVSVKFLGCLDTIGWSNFGEEPSEKLKEDEKLWKRGYFNFRHLLLNENIEYAVHALALDEDRDSHAPLLMFRSEGSAKPLRQVWFTGSHINIGGGQLTHEFARSFPFLKPDPNELSDIVFLFMISECHELLTFSKKRVNSLVSDYQLDSEVGLSALKESIYKSHWVAAKIDEPSDSSIFSRLRNAAISRKRHVRTPLRYRPHWFDDEPWNVYSSHESLHASSRYRKKHHPLYIPKALVGYHCTKTFKEFGPRDTDAENAPGSEAGPSYVRSKTEEESFYYDGAERSGARLYCGDIALPVIPMTAFEVLSAGGEGLIYGFGLSYKDIYRESPPVFRYTWAELNSMQEGWIFSLEPAPPRPSSMSMSDRVLLLKNARSLESSSRYHGLRVREDGGNTHKANTPVPRASAPRGSVGSEDKPLDATRGGCSHDASLADEGRADKGKGRHSGHSQRRQTGGDYENLSVRESRDRRFTINRNRSRSAPSVRAMLRRNPSNGSKKQADNFVDRGRSRERDGDSEGRGAPSVSPLRVPMEPEWMQRLREGNKVHPCKFKQHRKY
ncbi:hypothetical protein DRE_01156 [Drechslerella stenobrocha 248]|uniref:T6SS Phospholipase effector Tle1-like catalytic domain-containing protein n=1 Tax=Drechslerella stenobrocha 248 TaxID=1043628 RepID=W7I6C4_9PEZI|nr:hypothetical protein DRE_01156 [Drechslerella stenobrocha 248]